MLALKMNGGRLSSCICYAFGYCFRNMLVIPSARKTAASMGSSRVFLEEAIV